MGAVRPVVVWVVVVLLVILAAYLGGLAVFSPAEIVLGTAFFLMFATVSFLLINRLDKRIWQERDYETKLLRAFRRWLGIRIEDRQYQYLKLKYNEREKTGRAYLEDYTPASLGEVREGLAHAHRVTEYGAIERLDSTRVDPESLLAALKDLGWQVYYVRRPTLGQSMTYCYLKRER